MRDDTEHPMRPVVPMESDTSRAAATICARGDPQPSIMGPHPTPTLLRTVGKRETSKYDLSHFP